MDLKKQNVVLRYIAFGDQKPCYGFTPTVLPRGRQSTSPTPPYRELRGGEDKVDRMTLGRQGYGGEKSGRKKKIKIFTKK
jgi:hypothetical protein